MLELAGIHHVAIICSDYERSKKFYTKILGLQVIKETFRKERNSYKLDLSVNGTYQIELFSFRDSPARPSWPEALGLRHLAFKVPDVEKAVADLRSDFIETEAVRVDELTGKRFTFFSDPDGLPLEIYEE